MNMDTFHKAISMKRRSGSDGETQFVAYLAGLLSPTLIDEAGNLHFDLRVDQGNRTLFVAHTDTVSRGSCVNNEFTVDEKGFYQASGDTLGADDGAGVSILTELIQQQVPAYYIFLRSEERGGIGSKFVAKTYPKLLAEFDRAIAFDRRGYSDVITHQAGGRCASNEFAEALSDRLNDLGLLYMPCDGGIYTDTAEFVDFIPECTNISVGYDNEHGNRESQDGPYLQQLCEAALDLDWDSLPVKREPGDDGYDEQPRVGGWMFGGRTGYEEVIDTKTSFKSSSRAFVDDDYDDREQEAWFPTIDSPQDQDIADAVYSALGGDPEHLIRMVARRLGRSESRIDPAMFEPQEVEAIASYATMWDDVVETLVDEAGLFIN